MLRGHASEHANAAARGAKHAAQGASFMRWLGHTHMAAEQSVELAIVVINLGVNVPCS